MTNKDKIGFLLILIFILLVLCGCTTVPVARKFPEPPKYTEPCVPLQKLTDDSKLSDVASAINNNYSSYYECAVKNDAWIEWYQTQKRIFESVK